MPEPEQVEMRLSRRPRKIDLALVAAQPTLLAAVKLCVSLGGLERDKQVYMRLGIDAGHWTRIMQGSAHFPIDKLDELQDLCQNEAPLLWQLLSRKYDPASLRLQETDLERENRELREELDLERIRRRALADALRNGGDA